MLKNSKPYRASKKEYYINLRSHDAQVEANANGDSYKFSWNIKNIDNLSRRAKIGLIAYYDSAFANNLNVPLVIRCAQVQNVLYDSTGLSSPIIFLNNGAQCVNFPEYYPLATQNIDRIELYLTDQLADPLHGIDPNIEFCVQLKVLDYDVEDVDADIMPRYTSKSLAYFPPDFTH